ncbi:MAG: hypothetical protein OXB86_00270 [Bdellovibrionales bacterium]|nr:hypothetical protein [Bdellovibrionales bacterium]
MKVLFFCIISLSSFLTCLNAFACFVVVNTQDFVKTKITLTLNPSTGLDFKGGIYDFECPKYDLRMNDEDNRIDVSCVNTNVTPISSTSVHIELPTATAPPLPNSSPLLHLYRITKLIQYFLANEESPDSYINPKEPLKIEGVFYFTYIHATLEQCAFYLPRKG